MAKNSQGLAIVGLCYIQAQKNEGFSSSFGGYKFFSVDETRKEENTHDFLYVWSVNQKEFLVQTHYLPKNLTKRAFKKVFFVSLLQVLKDKNIEKTKIAIFVCETKVEKKTTVSCMKTFLAIILERGHKESNKKIFCNI